MSKKIKWYSDFRFLTLHTANSPKKLMEIKNIITIDGKAFKIPLLGGRQDAYSYVSERVADSVSGLDGRTL